MNYRLHTFSRRAASAFFTLFICFCSHSAETVNFDKLSGEYSGAVRPLLTKYCLDCHSAKASKGDLDLERFTSFGAIRKDLKPWIALLEMVETKEMPPKKKPQPSPEERQALVAWTRSLLDAEALAHAGDPGPAALRRLSNAEYNYTIRDLTGVDLQPAREFPADGAAGEGFTNAAEALNMSTGLLEKYLTASKEIASHAIFLPDGVRFSPNKTRRDWTDESLAVLRAFYAQFTSHGKLPLEPFLTVLIRQRDEIKAGKVTVEAVAAKEKLNAKYLKILWQALTAESQSGPLNAVRAKFRGATEKDAAGVMAEIAAWQNILWKQGHIGSYMNTVRQSPVDPVAAETQVLKLGLKPGPGKSEVVLYLVARDVASPDKSGSVIWQRPRFEGAKPVLLLKDYSEYGPKCEVEFPAIFGETEQYLSAAVEAANNKALTMTDLGKKNNLNEGLLERWIEILEVQTLNKAAFQPLKKGSPVVSNSTLAKWRSAAGDADRKDEAAKLSGQVQALFLGAQPAKEKTPDRELYDKLMAFNGPLLQGLDLAVFIKPAAPEKKTVFGLPKERFGRHPQAAPEDEANLIVPLNEVVEVRLPAALFRDREFVVEGKLDAGTSNRAVQFQVLAAPPGADLQWDGKSPLVAAANSTAVKSLVDGFNEFRNCFPIFICYPYVIPLDEIVCLKTFHREDEPLTRLFLNDEQTRRIDSLWEEHRFITRFPITENEYLPLFIGFVSQDGTKEAQAYFDAQRPVFKKRVEDFEKDFAAALPKQMESILDLAARAYRRPLSEPEKNALRELYDALHQKNVTQSDALQGVLARVLVSPSFLFHLEQSPSGKEINPVNANELASRLSYFLWSSVPDEEVRQAAASGRLLDPKVMQEQAQRMLKDEKIRALAIEFGTQWIHVRGFDELKEKNEALFPMFDEKLRGAIYEESILFFQDLFQNDRAATKILSSDDTYLNETLANHYGIPGVKGAQWRRVEGVKKFGRGGILGLASVQTKESGASRTSPVLRGNWVVETLLGEKLPRPPANVPRLPEAETGNDGLTMRQLVEKHVSAAECAVCHQRMDPFGFALEKYDPIGRLREKDSGGLPIDSKSKLRDGTEFEGMDGLRNYLLTVKKDVVVKLFCRRLLGFALCRQTTLSDQPLIDEMVAEMNKNDGKIASAVMAIVRSSQFRSIRGSDFDGNK